MGGIASIDPAGDPQEILQIYKSFIRGEIRHCDRGRWDQLECQLEEGDVLAMAEWIMGPWLKS
jgi:hypothetical protein